MLVAVLVLTFAFSRLELLYGHKFFDVTGTAQWIWDAHRLADRDPLAFFAAKDVELPANRYFTKIKIAGDPSYTLWFNGVEIGGRRFDEAETTKLDVYDVTPLAKTGRNRIVVALRSENGVGGLIASVDIAPDYQNVEVTGRDWKVFRRWSDALIGRDAGHFDRPMLLGRPPMRKWNYLEREVRVNAAPMQATLAPRAVMPIRTALPDIEVIGGVAVAVTTPTNATAFDFGPSSRGHVRLTLAGPSHGSKPVKVRFANDASELRPVEGDIETFVFAAGETSIVDPEERGFRYVMVYGGGVRADVVK